MLLIRREHRRIYFGQHRIGPGRIIEGQLRPRQQQPPAVTANWSIELFRKPEPPLVSSSSAGMAASSPVFRPPPPARRWRTGPGRLGKFLTSARRCRWPHEIARQTHLAVQ